MTPKERELTIALLIEKVESKTGKKVVLESKTKKATLSEARIARLKALNKKLTESIAKLESGAELEEGFMDTVKKVGKGIMNAVVGESKESWWTAQTPYFKQRGLALNGSEAMAIDKAAAADNYSGVIKWVGKTPSYVGGSQAKGGGSGAIAPSGAGAA